MDRQWTASDCLVFDSVPVRFRSLLLKMSSGRFVRLTEEELREITDGKDAKSTKNSTKYAANTFRAYLRDKNLPEDFENWSKADLDSRLRCFYAEVRSTSGELYKRTSLFSIRNGINIHLSKTSSIDITKDAEFDASNDMFSSMCKYTVGEGKGSVVHKDGIEHSDIEKLYMSMVFSVHTPTGLLNKVWFELCLHVCRRGRDNQRELTPQMFAIETDNLGKRYICQIRSEVTKNHQGLSSVDTDSKTVGMYETTTDNCPVKSVVKYLSKRHPKCESLFQRPRDSFNDDDDIWYERRPLGKTKLGNMMSDLSVAAALSKTYTNHCIRATAIATLDQAGYEARHMTVSGHRNEASIKSYSRDTSTDQKRKMSEAISSIIPANTCYMHSHRFKPSWPAC